MKTARLKIVLPFILGLSSFVVSAQSLVSSHTSVRTCVSDKECSSVSSSSYVFYDESKNAFYLKIDFDKLKVGVDSLDYWLDDLNDTYLFFKAPLRKEDFPTLSNSNAKTFKVNGQLFINDVWRSQSIELSIFGTENSSLNFSQNANPYKNYKVSFGFSIVPKEFKLHKKPHHLKDVIYISIGMGQINLLEPGMESFVQEAYIH